MTIATPARPLRVAVIGSGPSGFYAVEHLLRQDGLAIEVDLIDRLPTPYGLVRGGVAPDHQKIKSVVRVYEKVAGNPAVRFYGNVQVGRDVSPAELAERYDAVIYAVGAQTDRALDVPGEDLAGSHAATEFVGWYNGHPDYRDLHFDLSVEAVAVIGLGNVAMDVTRILAKTPAELASTDIAPHALEALAQSRVKTIYVIGRRGPAQAAFTNPEIRELGELSETEIHVDPAELVLDEASAAVLAAEEDRTAAKNLEILGEFARRAPRDLPRRIVLKFLRSPVALTGTDRVEGITLAANRLVADGRGGVKAETTDETETLPVGMVLRSVGYKGVAIAGIPFDAKAGTIPNADGRILVAPGAAEAVPGQYVCGWIKRGPSGVIGTNKPCSVETVDALLADLRDGRLGAREAAGRAGLESLLASRGVQWVTWADWKLLDALEVDAGKALGRPRVKLSRLDDMLSALGRARTTSDA